MIRSASPPPPPHDGPASVWLRPEPQSRPTPSPLSRARIVAAAIAIADAEGLASVSLRRVAAALGALPMRLYGYMATKEELLDLMVDAVFAEILARGPLSGDARAVLGTVAMRCRQASHAHPWFADLIGGRPNMGPNALAFSEAALAALTASPGGSSPGLASVDRALAALRTVNAYVVGALRAERAEAGGDLTREEWQHGHWPYLREMIATGRFPMIERVVREVRHPNPEEQFHEGLQTVLDGVMARAQGSEPPAWRGGDDETPRRPSP